MMLFGLIVGSVIILAGVIGLFVRPNPALAILGILFGLFMLGLGLQKVRERRLQIEFDKSAGAEEEYPGPSEHNRDNGGCD